MTIAEYIDTATLALLRAQNVLRMREIRARAEASTHAREFCNDANLRHVTAALSELQQVNCAEGGK